MSSLAFGHLKKNGERERFAIQDLNCVPCLQVGIKVNAGPVKAEDYCSEVQATHMHKTHP